VASTEQDEHIEHEQECEEQQYRCHWFPPEVAQRNALDRFAPSEAMFAIVAGIVMSYRRHDRFPWWLLGVAFGPLLVPFALGEERREEPTGRAGPPQGSQDEPFRRLLPSTTRGKQPRR
jgi:hypothetical protein